MKKQWSGERLEAFMYDENAIEHLHRYAIAMEYCKDKKVLDIACGEGYGANIMAQTAMQVTGIDIDAEIIRNAAKKYIRSNLDFIKGDITSIPIKDHTFDLVTCFETLEHTDAHEKVFHEVRRVLKPGGTALISTPDKKYYSDVPGYANPFHKKELYEDEFKSLIKNNFNYQFFLRQRFLLCSATISEQNASMRSYEGDYDKIKAKDNIDPVYWLAIASDKEIKSPSSSLFSGKAILQTALRQKETALKQTISYRIGHFILLPAKMIRSLFKKNISE